MMMSHHTWEHNLHPSRRPEEERYDPDGGTPERTASASPTTTWTDDCLTRIHHQQQRGLVLLNTLTHCTKIAVESLIFSVHSDVAYT